MNRKINEPLGDIIESYFKQYPFLVTFLKVFVALEIIFITAIWIFQMFIIQ